jgi:hypothetical protein
MSFCTAVNCMDGRVQLPVIRYLQGRFNVEHVDSVTEPAPNLILAKRRDEHVVQSILSRIRVSVESHSSVGIALAGHHECAGNPATQVSSSCVVNTPIFRSLGSGWTRNGKSMS